MLRHQKLVLEQPFAPARRVGEAAHAEQREADAEHAVDAEQRGVGMRRRRVQPLHVVERERRIDEEAEQARADRDSTPAR